MQELELVAGGNASEELTQEDLALVEEHHHVVEPDAVRTLTRLNRRIDALRVRYGPRTVITVRLAAFVPKEPHANDPTE